MCLLWFVCWLVCFVFLPLGYISDTNSCYLEHTFMSCQVIIHQILQSSGRVVNPPSRQSFWGFGQGALLAERILWLPYLRAWTVSVTQRVILSFHFARTACEAGLYAVAEGSLSDPRLYHWDTALWFEKSSACSQCLRYWRHLLAIGSLTERNALEW
jgi:hypothetical protein